MAEAIARYDAADVMEVSSAGLHPLGYIADLTKQTLLRNGYTAEGLTSDALTPEAIERADVIINLTGRPREQHFGKLEKVEDWMVQDPFGADPETYQQIFQGIQRRVRQLTFDLRHKPVKEEPAK